MLNKNDTIELEITAVAHDGNGLGRHEGMVVFVPMTVDGDLARVQVVKVQKTAAYGIVKELLRPSPHREENDCPIFHRCGGCALRHIQYSHELEIKQSWVEENLRRIGGVDVVVQEILPSPQLQGYRNKAQIPVALENGKAVAGFFAPRSHRVIPWESCALQPPVFNRITRFVLDFMDAHKILPYDETSHKGLVRHIYLRCGETTGQVMVCLVINGKSLPHEKEFVDQLTAAFEEVSTVTLNSNTRDTNVILGSKTRTLWGSGVIQDEICGVKVELSAQSFYQVNRRSAERLYELAGEFAGLTGKETVLDLYCGVGTVGLSMAKKAGKLIGVEIIPQAVEDARRNAELGGYNNAEFFCGDAREGARYLEKQGIRPDVVLVDPPRKGCDQAVLESIEQMAPEKIVYISCNSATLARDCRILEQMGYRVTAARPVDLFPRTSHVEAVIMMTYCGSDKKNRS
ncbi:23S rRNA (uracil(1939)-C(5))-methyltransferase RlmD [Oscillospiraceae bacterium MB08-C2-2]|nr:23S rRNA (uracil(1939)-C(5))-methyltransferase RlmD [Oscillospiraceae bacterium MB08-C2-2]